MSKLMGMDRKKTFNENSFQGHTFADKRVDKTSSNFLKQNVKKRVLSEVKNVMPHGKHPKSKPIVLGKPQLLVKNTQKSVSVSSGNRVQSSQKTKAETFATKTSTSIDDGFQDDLNLTDIEYFDIERACGYPKTKRCGGMDMWSDMSLTGNLVVNKIIEGSPRNWSAKKVMYDELNRANKELQFSPECKANIDAQDNNNQHDSMLEDICLDNMSNFLPNLPEEDHTMAGNFILKLPELTKFDYE